MQKLLNTHRFAPYLLLQRILLHSKAGLLAGLTLLLLAGLANPAKAGSGFFKNYIVINGKYYYTINDGTDKSNPNFTTVGNLGTFDRGTGKLTLGGESNTFNDNGDDVQSVQLYYRVYLQGNKGGAFAPLPLGYNGGGGNNKQWVNTTTNPNLLTATNGQGRYVVEIYIQAHVNKPGGTSDDIYDSAGGANYTATFDVTGSVPTQWAGRNTNWFDDNNWDHGVPTKTTDATISFTTATGPYPVIDGSSATATVRTLTILGTTGPDASGAIVPQQGARLFLNGSQLSIHGDFIDENAGFQQIGGIFDLAGTGNNDQTNSNQTFSGGTFTDVRIDGSGIKILKTLMIVNGTLTIGSGQIGTSLANSANSGVVLGPDAQILGESESTGYVLGVLRTTRIVVQGAPNNFGNMGVELTANDASPGSTTLVRITNLLYNGVGKGSSIRRSFTFTPTNNSSQNFDLTFRYLNPELNGNHTTELALFRSVNSGKFDNLKRSSNNLVTETLTLRNITSPLAALYTLGTSDLPLPVNLTAFTAVAQGPDAVLNWATAQEINSQGFEVQVSADGTTFRKLGFVASTTPNSSEARTYQYRDAEAGKQGTRYYRLRQLDLDGKEGFFGPQAVTFGAALAGVQGYPNPFGSEINLTLQATAAGQATVSVLDGVGRQVRTWQPALAAGASSLLLSDLQTLPHGLYVVQVRYSDGQTQRLKLVKE